MHGDLELLEAGEAWQDRLGEVQVEGGAPGRAGGQVVRWSGGQVVRWSGGQVVRWSGG